MTSLRNGIKKVKQKYQTAMTQKFFKPKKHPETETRN